MRQISFLKKLKFDFDIIVFLQPTTPFRQKNELDKAIKYCIDGNFDTVFSGISYKPFYGEFIKIRLDLYLIILIKGKEVRK